VILARWRVGAFAHWLETPGRVSPVLGRYLPSPSALAAAPPLPEPPVRRRRRGPAPPLPPAPPRHIPRPSRTPGSRPISMQRPTSWDEYGDPISDLRWGGMLSLFVTDPQDADPTSCAEPEIRCASARPDIGRNASRAAT